MDKELEVNKEKLGINEWLELIKEDKNLTGAYISIAQYIYLLETELKKQQKVIDRAIGLVNTPWSFESGNKKVDEIVHQKKIELIKLLEDKEVSE